MLQIEYNVTFSWEVNLLKKNDGFWEYMGRRAKVFTYIKKFHFNNSFREY